MDVKIIDKNMADGKSDICINDKWFDLNNKFLRGRAFNDGYCRISKDVYISSGIETLKYHTTGFNITFKTNAKYIKIKANLKGPSYMSHMTGVGQVGFDLYYKHNNEFVFISSTKTSAKEYEITLVDNLDKEIKEFRLYFPLYQGLNKAEIGINQEATLEFIKEKQEKIVIYGTSISQGGCASRPGMGYSNILDRLLNYEIINLGFSGSAHLEDEMINVLNCIESNILILEVEANNSSNDLDEKLSSFIERINIKNILLITHFPNALTLLNKELDNIIKLNYDIQKKIKNIILINGNEILKELNYDATVDGSHLTDLGFFVLANGLIPYINKIKS